MTMHENEHDDDVAGTVRILEHQFGTDDNDHIVYVPTPSSDPNDPLNWTKSRKYMHLACITL